MRALIPVLSALLLGCPDDPEPEPETTWYTTCGDPVCSGYGGPFDGVSVCEDEEEGTSCADEGAQCDLQDDCNTFLLCAVDDPKDQTGGCPISRAVHKREVRYLDATERDALAARALELRLARWRYRWDDEAVRPHVGFLIDDVPGSPAVRPDGERVDLYGYTSMAVAALQAQQARLEAQQAELEALRAEVEALKQALADTPPR